MNEKKKQTIQQQKGWVDLALDQRWDEVLDVGPALTQRCGIMWYRVQPSLNYIMHLQIKYWLFKNKVWEITGYMFF